MGQYQYRVCITPANDRGTVYEANIYLREHRQHGDDLPWRLVCTVQAESSNHVGRPRDLGAYLLQRVVRAL